MILIVQSMLIYTGLAISRNMDELSGEPKTSILTHTMNTASRTGTIAPMACILFVACRMYVLGVTNGEGTYQPWVAFSILAVTIGLSLQTLLSLLLPLLTNQPDESKSLAELSGGMCDAHPKLAAMEFKSDLFKVLAWVMQFVSIVLIYGNGAAIIVGIYTYPTNGIPMPVPIQCTCTMASLFLLSSFAVWAARTYKDVHKFERGTSAAIAARRFERAALGISMAMQKAPMIAILFLVVKARAVELSPPEGKLPRSLRMAMYTATWNLVVECFTSAWVGITGKESKGYYGNHIFQSSTVAHVFQHTSACFSYMGVLAVIITQLFLKPGSNIAGLGRPPSLHCLYFLQALYFGVHFVKTVTFWIQDVAKRPTRAAQDMLLSATSALAPAPLISVLFVAARMQALQLTQQMGTPQVWAQECMVMCTFALFVQVLSCLLLPFFTGSFAVDSEGNPAADMSPGGSMLGAYTVTCIKYCCLMCLHCGIAAISVSVFLATQGSCMTGDDGRRFNLSTLIHLLEAVAVATGVSLALSGAKVIGLIIKVGIESADQVALGTDINVGYAALSICEGYVNVTGLVVENPPSRSGRVWKSPCLAKVDKLIVKINIWRLVTSLGKEFEITAIVLNGVQVTFEKSAGANSNVGEILQHINDMVAQVEAIVPVVPVQEEGPKEGEPFNPVRFVPAIPPEPEAKKPTDNGEPQVILKLVSFKDIGASAILQGAPFTIQVGDLEFDDFQSKLEGQGGSANIAANIVVLILHTLLKTVLSNISFVGGAGAVVGNMTDNMRDVGKHVMSAISPRYAMKQKEISKRAALTSKDLDEDYDV